MKPTNEEKMAFIVNMNNSHPCLVRLHLHALNI